MRIKVLKFGGSSFPQLGSYNEIALYAKERLETDADRIVLVVSAMSGTTGKLQEAGLVINPDLSTEITDSLLGTGEMVAACLMRAALEGIGILSSHITGYQLGVVTDSKFTRAKPKKVSAEPILNLLRDVKVVVVSGGQAIDELGRLTMLGRNSSDLTAVILAAALGTGECEIFSDVPGVYSADPYLVPDARPIQEIPYESIITMSRNGAKVLHHGAVSYAEKHSIKILCRGTTGDHPIGTVIGLGPCPNAVVTNRKVEVIKLKNSSDAADASDYFEKQGLVSILVTQNLDTFLVISQENRAWKEVLDAYLGTYTAVMPKQSILTVLTETGKVKHLLVPSEKVEKLASIMHDAIIPIQSTANPAGIALNHKKQRSVESSLLIGS